jgi:CheY-like chemotaxis protein
MTRSGQKTKNFAPTAPAVLLVDDNPDDQFFFRLAWEKNTPAYPLRLVSSQREAKEYLGGEGKFGDRITFPFPSLVVLDMRLPDGSGCELVRWIRAHASFNRLAVIILSGSAQDHEVNSAYSSGVNSFLVKSSSPHDLRRTVSLIQSYWLTQNLSLGPSQAQA